MRLSVSVTNYSWPHREIRAQLAALADTLDDSAVDTLWVADHLLQADPSSRLDEPMLEAYTALGFLPPARRGYGWAPWSPPRHSAPPLC
jgi:alkanesulfonate monooxygenase SsuD/methylene tetrahydromethanopterin reductase-like flavin-dependent oxidoreductase (luciferase family)